MSPFPPSSLHRRGGSLGFGVRIMSLSLSSLVTLGTFLISDWRDTHSLTAEGLNPFSPGARRPPGPCPTRFLWFPVFATSCLNVLHAPAHTWPAPEGLSGGACPLLQASVSQAAFWLLLTLLELSPTLSPKPATRPPLPSYYFPQYALC